MPATIVTWCLIVGVLLIVIGTTDTWRQNMPFSTSALYLGAGWLLGPQGLGFLQLSLADDAVLLERLAEAAVLVSLFAVGLRLRVPLSDPLWRAPLLLATLAMVFSIALLTGVAMAIGFTSGAAVLIAAVLAPTDPVLASDVQVEHARDRDRLRFSLTGEGGLNDGTAFPFVMLGLGLLGAHELGPAGVRWWTVDLGWAVGAGLGIGWGLGTLFSRAVVYLRCSRSQALGMESFLTLGLIALTYGAALAAHSYGFLAVFAAGLAMRHVEQERSPDDLDERAVVATAAASDSVEDPGLSVAADPRLASAYMAKEVLDFTLDLEKLAEFTVMLLVGSLLTPAAFTPATVGLALALIFVVRPVAVYATTWRLPYTRAQRRLAAWFGIRGIGSLYYLAYAVSHGAEVDGHMVLADAVLVTIALSVLLHGSSAAPFMRVYRRWSRRPKAG